MRKTKQRCTSLITFLKIKYGVAEIMNLFPSINRDEAKESAVENLKYIQEAITRVDDVIIAVEKGVETNKKGDPGDIVCAAYKTGQQWQCFKCEHYIDVPFKYQ